MDKLVRVSARTRFGPEDFSFLIPEEGRNEKGRKLKKVIKKSSGGKETTKEGKFWRKPGYIGFRSANAYHRVDLEKGTNPLTIFIPGPFGLRKGPRAKYSFKFNNE